MLKCRELVLGRMAAYNALNHIKLMLEDKENEEELKKIERY